MLKLDHGATGVAISCDLEEHDAEFVRSQVTAGHYRDAAEVVHRALALLKANEAAFLALDAKLHEGLADIEAGRVHDADQVFADLLARLAVMPQSLEG